MSEKVQWMLEKFLVIKKSIDIYELLKAGTVIDMINLENKGYNMKIRFFKFLIISVMLLTFLIFGQDRQNIQQELERLRITLQRTHGLVNLFPDADFTILIKNELHKAQEEYQKAKSFFDQGRFTLSRAHIRASYQFISNIEKLIKSRPAFTVRFRERLDLKIEQAENVVISGQKNEAIFMLNRAKFFRQKAYSKSRENKLFAALEYYRLAIFFADKAIQISGSNDRITSNNLRGFFSETEILLDRAKSITRNSNKPQLEIVFQKAENDLKDARRLYSNGSVEAAREKLLIVNRSLYRIIDLSENIPQSNTERLPAELETLKLSMKSIKEEFRNIDSPAARQLYKRITNLIQSIEIHLNQNQLDMARQKLRLANRLMVRIYRLLQMKTLSYPQQLEQQLVLARQNYQELLQTVGQPEFSDLLELAEINLQKAENTYRSKNYLQSTHYLIITNRLILKINRLNLVELSFNRDSNEVASDLERLRGLLERLESTRGDDEFNVRHENSKKLYQIAQNAYVNKEYYTCHELTKMGINLITK